MTEDNAGVSTSSEVDNYEWELCRENVQPIRGGRRVGAINQALAHVAPKAATVVAQRFEALLTECEEAEDPLSCCLNFCVWFDEAFPIGRQRLYYEHLWKIINKYAKEERYLNDERMLKIWIRLAENSLGHGWEVYQHANSIGSLLRSSGLYIHWSQDLELRGSVSDARDVLRRGKLSGADHQALTAEEDELEMREMRRELDRRDANADADDDDEWETDENGERVALTRIAPIGVSSLAPVIRLPSIVGEQGSSRLDRGQGRVHHHGAASEGKGTMTRQQRANAAAFQVYRDDDDEKSSGDEGAPPENPLESLYDMFMDNHIERLSLKDPEESRLTLSQNTDLKASSSHSHQYRPSFKVWCDDEKENVDPNGKGGSSSGGDGDEKGKVVKKPRLMLRKCMIGDSREEWQAEQWRVSHENSKVIRRLDFDDDDE